MKNLNGEGGRVNIESIIEDETYAVYKSTAVTELKVSKVRNCNVEILSRLKLNKAYKMLFFDDLKHELIKKDSKNNPPAGIFSATIWLKKKTDDEL